jgi:hypothetical protein
MPFMRKRNYLATTAMITMLAVPGYAMAQEAPSVSVANKQAADNAQKSSDGSSSERTAPTSVTKLPTFPLPVIKEANSPDGDGKNEPDFNVHTIRLVNVPMRLLPPSLDQQSDPLWVQGRRPENNLLAVASAVPSGAVSINLTDTNGSVRAVTLVLAKLHPRYGVSKNAPKDISNSVDIFCGSGLANADDLRVYCFEDLDADSRFDRIAQGRSDVGFLLPTDVSHIFNPVRLATPLAYTSVPSDQLPKTEIEWRNCGQDWDKPYFSIGTKGRLKTGAGNKIDFNLLLKAADPSTLTPAERTQFLEMLGNQSGAAAECERGDRIDSFQNISETDLAKGSILVDLGSMIFSVGPKKNGAAVKLLGFIGNSVTYQIEGRGLRHFQLGLSRDQKRIAVAQLFDKPTLVATGEMSVASLPVSNGDELFKMGFAHGYLGELSRTTTINTLFSSRSLAAGTLLYGIPMTSQRRVTINGIPQGGFGQNGDDDRSINTSLVWCLPVRDEEEKIERKSGAKSIQVNWTATCLPYFEGEHTILKGQRPAFALSSLSFNAETKTNGGPAPVRQVEKGSFGAPLEFRYFLVAGEETMLRLRRETWFGDEKVEQTEDVVSFKDGVAKIETGGAKIEIRKATVESASAVGDANSPSSYVATLVEPPKAGEAAVMRFSAGAFRFGN